MVIFAFVIIVLKQQKLMYVLNVMSSVQDLWSKNKHHLFSYWMNIILSLFLLFYHTCVSSSDQENICVYEDMFDEEIFSSSLIVS